MHTLHGICDVLKGFPSPRWAWSIAEPAKSLPSPRRFVELVAVQDDPQKAYEYFLRTQGWDKQTVDQQVLTPLDERSIMGTPADQTSIMCYQLPGSITRDGQSILGGVEINQTDYGFVGLIYPKAAHDLMPEHEEEWDASEDVEVVV
jgi:hypothetical protein